MHGVVHYVLGFRVGDRLVIFNLAMIGFMKLELDSQTSYCFEGQPIESIYYKSIR